RYPSIGLHHSGGSGRGGAIHYRRRTDLHWTSLVRQEIADVRYIRGGGRDRYSGGARAGTGDGVAYLSPHPDWDPDQQRPEIGLAGGRLDRKLPPLARRRFD